VTFGSLLFLECNLRSAERINSSLYSDQRSDSLTELSCFSPIVMEHATLWPYVRVDRTCNARREASSCGASHPSDLLRCIRHLCRHDHELSQITGRMLMNHSTVSHDGSSFGGIQLLLRRGCADSGNGCNVKPVEFIDLPECLIECNGCNRPISTAFASGATNVRFVVATRWPRVPASG